ncbi:ABC transporter G family member 17 isoform X2 [Physcomitrium patens]|uniref:ABC transporter G family member STR2 n=1 Tax=Physcomitrium patens TaxID=3218 RepID=A0A7I4EIX8_PHYPA|nr:ABC transporter G family member 17-like isoform X2 [Physcomitrium patens]|eukprot:XP_024384304.1 ABC transporter G family member 17-like isoform X2 [Physcomitrella patens]
MLGIKEGYMREVPATPSATSPYIVRSMSAGSYGGLDLAVPVTKPMAPKPPVAGGPSKPKELTSRNGKGQNGSTSTGAVSVVNKNFSNEVTVVGGNQEVISAQVNLDIWLEFRDLTYTVASKRRLGWDSFKWVCPCFSRHKNEVEMNPAQKKVPVTKSLLQGISGKAKDGEILAVMGPSGSGKSTLIDALAQRIDRKSLVGSITLNGQEVDPDLLRNISAYVMQDDLLFPMLTVKETLMFAANVRLPASHGKEAKIARVNSMIRQLGLGKVADTIIGDESHRGVSGGERRRVSIGIDIVHGPLLLFLDEPTSGLDSSSAFMVVETLRHIAEMGSIVIFSVHQPSDRILGLIDNLLILANGQMIYMGHPKELTAYFTAFNHGYPIPSSHGNAAEFAIDLIQILSSMPEGIRPLVTRYKVTSSYNHLRGESSPANRARLHPATPTGVAGAIAASIAKGRLMSTSGYVEHCNDSATLVLKFANTRSEEIKFLTWRCITNIRRTPELFYTRLGTVTVSGLLLATIFWQLDHTPKGLQERLGFFTFAMTFSYYSCVDTLPIFLQERYIFIRETAHNAYRKSSYVLANALIYIPFLGLLSFAFAVTTFWAVGLAGGFGGFCFFFLIIWASFWAAVVRNELMRSSASSCYETAGQIFTNTPLAPYIPETLVNSVLETLKEDVLSDTPYSDLNGSTCIMDGMAVLQNQDITQLGKWSNLVITIAFGVVYRVLFYFVLGKAQNQRH